MVNSCGSPKSYFDDYKVREASWDGNEQNSGLIAYTDKGFLISSNAAKRYSFLTEKYGKTRNIEKDEGLQCIEEKWYLSFEYMAEFIILNNKHTNDN